MLTTKKIEMECECFCERVSFEMDEDGFLYIAIADRVRGRPKWHEIVLYGEKIDKLREILNQRK
jgi:hypothetical protein